MKKLLLACLLFTGWSQAQNITFKDPAFKNYLVNYYVSIDYGNSSYKLDLNNDGEISTDEVNKLTYLQIENDSNIISIDGIENFINIKTLIISDSKNIATIDVSTLLNLNNIELSGLKKISTFKASDKLETLYINGFTSNSSNIGICNNIDFTMYPNLNRVGFYHLEYNSNSIDFSTNKMLDFIEFTNFRTNSPAGIITPEKLNRVNINQISSQISFDFTKSVNLNYVKFMDVNVTSLDFSKCVAIQILDLNNLNSLTNLDVRNTNINSLVLSDINQLTTLDLSNNPKLRFLFLSNLPQLTTLDISNNIDLTGLSLTNLPQLTTLDISNNIDLTGLSLTNLPQLTTLDISKNTALDYLDLSSINLASLDVSKSSKLGRLFIANTKIPTLDLSKNIELKDLVLNNEIKNLDLSNNSILDSLVTGTNLEYLNLKKGSHLSHITLAKPNTHLYICADDQNIPVIAQSIKDSNLVNIEVNSYCTFTPGGVYNTITNNVKFDLTGNCTGNDNFTLFTKFRIEDTNGKGISVTNNQGVVNFYKQAGTYKLTPQLENPNYFQISPSLVNFNLMDNSGHDTTINYCITPNGIHNDLEIVLSPIGPARPGFDSKYQVTYKNKGNQTLSGDFTVEYNDSVLDLVASSLNVVSTGKLGKSFVDLKPFEISVSDTIVFKVNSPIEVPAVNIGDTLKFITTINPLQGDEKPEDNVAKFNQIVVGAYDPNIITCLQGNVLPSKEIGKTLHYTIDFENTGNYPAENIVVVETIDPKKYDINSIQILNTSHPMKLRIEGNKVEYYFQNIDLGEHKHGNILLKLRALSNLIEGDTINKQANIYFDYNAPVETNKETTVYKDQLLASIKGITLDESIIAYPNPNNGVFTLKAASQISSIAIYDLHGRIIQTIIVNDFTNNIDLSNQDAGIYLLKVTTDTGANVIEIKKD